MVMRDMVLSGRLPGIGEFWRYDGTFTLYKLGQSVLDFIGETYGEDRIRAIYDGLLNAGNFDAALEQALGLKVSELSDRWAHSVRRRYYPEIANHDPVAFRSQQLTRGPADLGPLPVPAGVAGMENRFLFLSPRTGYTDIYSGSMEGLEKNLRTVIHGERQGRFESLHLFRARMDINRKGELLFVSQRAGEDVIYVYSLVGKKVVEDHRFDSLVGLRSPTWSPDGRRFVFSGLSRAGQADLYMFDRDSRASSIG